MRAAASMLDVLTPALKPARLWLIDFLLEDSRRCVCVMQEQKKQPDANRDELDGEIRKQHMRQVRLSAKRRQVERWQ